MAHCPKCKTAIGAEAHFCPDCGEALKATDEVNIEPGAMLTVGGLETLSDTQTSSGRGNATPTLEAGEVFADRYLIDGIIGRGGMGVVYRAKDKLSDKTVALKLIRPERLAGEAAVKRLIAEGITARDIRHPNIVAVYDVGEAKGQPFVSMEYLDGKSLRAWHREQIQKREDIPLRVAARIMLNILDGLKAAHDAGVIHRDLKPENIVLVGDPTENDAPLKILDFGIARATGGAMDSGTGTGLGTPRYMAPEQITNADSVGPPADIYSASVLFYELLVDVLPQGHWQPPSGGRSDVPSGIDQLIEKGLSNRPANRPQTAKLFRKSLIDAVNIITHDNKRDLPIRQILLWGGAGTGVLLFFLVIAAVMSGSGGGATSLAGPCDELSGAAYDRCMGTSSRAGTPPPSRINYSQLSGTWYSSTGSLMQVDVDNGGDAFGHGAATTGEPVDFLAEFNGSSGQYQMIGQVTGMDQSGRLTIVDTNHIRYSGPGGQQACFHINHNDRKMC